jgi:2-polyprenyl-3-methyl-5-hydroxy-6-metoxy-1,4-benzoquinol methylase
VQHAKKVTHNRNLQKTVSKSNVYDDVRINVLTALMDIAGTQVLDVGCGTGEFLLKLEFLGAYVTGIDLSLDAVNEAHESGLRNVFKVPFSEFNDGIKYDLIVLNDVIEHPLEPLKLIEKASSLLKSGGMLLIWTPNNDNIFLDVEKKTLRVDLEHMQYLGSKACKQLSLAHNFEIVHYESLGSCTYSSSNERNLTKKFLIIFLKIFFLYPIIRKIYKLFKFKHDRRGNYHLFTIFKKSW